MGEELKHELGCTLVLGIFLPRIKDDNSKKIDLCANILGWGPLFKFIQLSTKFCKELGLAPNPPDSDLDVCCRMMMMMMMMMMVMMMMMMICTYIYIDYLFKQKKTRTLSQTRVVILQEPAADAEPCSMSFDPQGTYYRCAGVWIFSASDIPLSLKEFHRFLDSQNFVRRCAPFRDDSRFFLEHDVLKCPRKENGFVSGAFNVQNLFLTDSHGIKQSV